mmetsp:Transcript_66548/g.191309  ORF Transcript_66548/g.191309 Transcript_66548/m.191309 type:complete len:218 (+) Transcript_66548:829-1482(+)
MPLQAGGKRLHPASTAATPAATGAGSIASTDTGGPSSAGTGAARAGHRTLPESILGLQVIGKSGHLQCICALGSCLLRWRCGGQGRCSRAAEGLQLCTGGKQPGARDLGLHQRLNFLDGGHQRGILLVELPPQADGQLLKLPPAHAFVLRSGRWSVSRFNACRLGPGSISKGAGAGDALGVRLFRSGTQARGAADTRRARRGQCYLRTTSHTNRPWN